MAEALTSAKTLLLDRGREAVSDAILKALPKDAIVRSEDDAVGRYAGDRTVVLVGRYQDGFSMFHGSFGSVKRRLEDTPDLRVELEAADAGTKASLKLRVEESKPLQEILGSVISNGVSVAVLIFAFNYYRGVDTDPAQTALIAVGIAVVVTLIARRFGGPSPAESLSALVEDAIKPFARKPLAEADNDADAT